jgi:hypothetical protein
MATGRELSLGACRAAVKFGAGFACRRRWTTLRVVFEISRRCDVMRATGAYDRGGKSVLVRHGEPAAKLHVELVAGAPEHSAVRLLVGQRWVTVPVYT